MQCYEELVARGLIAQVTNEEAVVQLWLVIHLEEPICVR